MNSEKDLWVDFLKLGEKYRDKISIPDFGYLMVQFTCRMLYDCAPNRDKALEIIKEANKSGYNWHLKKLDEKENIQ